MTDTRLAQLELWLEGIAPKQVASINKLAGDASFRRYFRVIINEKSYVVMDAPPEKENCQPFIAIAKAFAKENIQVPDILHINLEHGFLVLSDLGDDLLLNKLNPDTANSLYAKALEVIPRIQYCKSIPNLELAYFCDQPIVNELSYFETWFLQKHLNLEITHEISSLLEDVFATLISTAQSQPRVCVHRDYHSRNLLLLENNSIGVIDFQDAIWGPIAYDAVSILRDCYIAWPRSQVEQWALQFYDLINGFSLKKVSADNFIFWFDYIGIQRHLKVLGIFSRLFHRDQKPNYLKDIPRILQYVIDVCDNYPKLFKFKHFLCEVIEPALMEKEPL